MKRIQIFLLIISSIVLAVGCKKETTNQPDAVGNNAEIYSIQNVKDFYQNAVAPGQHSASFDENPLMKYINDSIEWDRAMYFPEQKTYIVPVFFLKTKMNESSKVFKFMVFTDLGGSYTGYANTVIAGKDIPLYAFDEKKAMDEVIKELRSGATAGIRHIKYSLDYSEPLNKDHRLAVKEETPQSSLQGEPQSNYADPSEECHDNGGTMITIDWYYQTYVNGILVYEEYLYSTQECSVVLAGGGGGGTGTNSPDYLSCVEMANQAYSTVSSTNVLMTHLQESDNGLTRVRLYSWQYAKGGLGGLYRGIAYDRGVHYRARTKDPWKWQSLTNVGSSTTGTYIGPSGTTLEFSVVHVEAIVGLYNAKMNLIYHVKATGTRGLITYTRSENKTSTMNYDINTSPMPGY